MRRKNWVLGFGSLAMLLSATLGWPSEAQSSGSSSSLASCVKIEDGPPGGCPEGDCFLACGINDEVESDLVTVHLWLNSLTETPCGVSLTSEQGAFPITLPSRSRHWSSLHPTRGTRSSTT